MLREHGVVPHRSLSFQEKRNLTAISRARFKKKKKKDLVSSVSLSTPTKDFFKYDNLPFAIFNPRLHSQHKQY